MSGKLRSRKFWLAAAAFLASLGTGIAGIAAGSDALATAGAACMVLSAAIYAAAEAYVDGKAVPAQTTVTSLTGKAAPAKTEEKEAAR